VCEYPVELEQPFIPFYACRSAPEVIDDGKSQTWLGGIASFFKEEQQVPQTAPQHRRDAAPIPFDSEDGLAVLRIHVPKQSRSTVSQAESALRVLASCAPPMAMEIVADAERILLQLVVRERVEDFVRHQLAMHLPECVLEETDDDALLEMMQAEQALYVTDFGLSEEYMRPLATHGGSHEPLLSLYAVLENLRGNEQAALQVLFSGAVNDWAETTVESVTDQGASFFRDAPEMPRLAQEKVARPLFAATVRILAQADSLEEAGLLLQQLAVTLISATSSPFNSLMPLADERYEVRLRLHDMLMRRSHRTGMLLNSAELATLVHPPSGGVSKRLSGAFAVTAPLPASLVGHLYHLGTNTHLGKRTPATLDRGQRSRHVHIVGGSGTGKSTLLHSLIMQDIVNGEGCMLIDPHGDLYEAVLNDIPLEHAERVVLIDPTDASYPIGFNIFSAHSDLERELLSSDLVALLRRFSTSWGDQMHSISANAINAFLFNTENGTLGDLRKFLIDPAFRARVLQTVTDPEIAYYWQKEYPLLRNTSIGSILTRLDTFLRPKVIRSMVCQAKSLDFRMLMDTKKVVLVKLSQGLLGAENSYLLGACIVAKLQQIAMARQSQDAHERTPFYCYIDEFHHFVSPSLNEILSGSRKYALSLIVAHQQLSQLSGDHAIAESVMANAGTRIVFRASDTDARRLQETLARFGADDIQNLKIGEAIVRVNTNDGCFNIEVKKHVKEDPNSYKETITELSRMKYGNFVPPGNPAPPEPPPPDEPPPIPTSPKSPTQPPEATPKYQRAEPAPPQPKVQREHVRLQQRIRKLGQELGFVANVEVPTSDSGLVDVLLERGGRRIAVEVSVSTSSLWELHNVRKCLAAGFEHIIVCCSSVGRVARFEQRISAGLTNDERLRVHVLTVNELDGFIASLPSTQPKEHTMKGYRVKVQYDGNGINADDILRRIASGK
jgi:hypothetical protein